jgi:membrane protease YdiL (CAAX protease family)
MQILANFLDTHFYLIVVLAGAACFLVWLVARQKNLQDGREAKRTIWSFLFIWPLMLTKKQGDKIIERGFSKREWVGWLIVFIIAVLAIILTPSRARSVELVREIQMSRGETQTGGVKFNTVRLTEICKLERNRT